MSADRVRRALELVEAALAIDAAERPLWLHQACDGDTELEKEAAELLELEPIAAEFLSGGDATTASGRPKERFAWLADGAASDLAAGTQLGDFLIEGQIGAGGMGVVYRALQLSLNRPVALKVLPMYLRHSASANSRFRREIEAAARLHHNHIVSVYTTGKHNETTYYAMELIDGPPLSQILDHLRAHPIPELSSTPPCDQFEGHAHSQAVSTPTWAIQSFVGSRIADATPVDEIMSRAAAGTKRGNYFDRVSAALANVADALGYAHSRDVVHRDVKPSNMLLCSEGQLHISDFGLARFIQEPGMTRTGEMLGTPYYMAPEQITAGSHPIDGRADIYALGATLYEMLTLRPPFVGKSHEHIVAQIIANEPVAPRRLNRRIPRDLETICLKALEKSPTDRYQTAEQVAGDLRAYGNRYAISAKRPSPIARTLKWARRHRGVAITMVIAGALAAIALFFAVRAHQSQFRWSLAQQEQVFETALLAALEGKSDDAQLAVEEARRLGAPAERIHMLEGQVDLMATRHTHAYEHFEQAASQMPDNVAAHSLLALSCMRRQLYDQGEAVFQHVKRLAPITLNDYLQRARVEAYFNAGAAVDTLDAAIARNRSSLVARLIRAEVQTGRAIDTGDAGIAEAALADYEILGELLDDSPLVAGGHMMALLATATTYDSGDVRKPRAEVLRRAAELADVLNGLDAYGASRARAFYFDYIGDVDQALAEWRKFRHRQILFPVLTLYREGRFDEALETCQHVEKGARTERMIKFFQAFVGAANNASQDMVRASFPKRGAVQLDPIHELLTVYTVACLVDSPEVARRDAARLRASQQLPSFRDNWYHHLIAFAVGEMASEDLLQYAVGSRKSQCEGHYYIGITKLGSGNRSEAHAHFQRSADARVFSYFEHFLSRALLAQLDRKPNWPEWISAN